MPSQYETLAREALIEITPATSIGEVASESKDDDGVITVRFASTLGGYPGWQWNVSLSHVDGYDPTVIEAELMPDAGALLSPDWVPWSERLADYKAAQEAAGLAAEDVAALDGEIDDDDDDDDDDDRSRRSGRHRGMADGGDDEGDDDMDDMSDGGGNLHSGDIDGVDIDELDELNLPEPDEGPDDDDEPDEIADEVGAFGAQDTEDI